MDTSKPVKGGKQLYIQHLDSDLPRPAREYLLSLGVEKKSVDLLFDQKGDWKYKVQDKIDPFLFTPENLEIKLLECLKPVYDLVSRSLDSINELGFAKHDIPHIKDVTEEVRKLLEESGADSHTRIIGVIAAVIHDLGNILSRKHHSKLSPLIFKLTFPNFIINIKDWYRVKRAVVYHDEPVIFEEIKSWGNINSLQRIEKYSKVFSPEVLALLVSDKTRVNRKRLSDKNQTMKAIDNNEHYEVNLLGETEGIFIDYDTAIIKFKYHPYANADEVLKYPGFFKKSKHYGYRAGVSKQTIALHKYDTPIDNFSAWKHKYWKIYTDRTLLAVYSIFALFPQVEKVLIQMVDYISPISLSCEMVEYNIYKSELEKFERIISLKYSNIHQK